MKRKVLSNVDLALLEMDTPNNLMVITGLMILESRVDPQRLKETIEQRLLTMDRFRQRVVKPFPPLMRPYWQDDPGFDLDNHLILIDRPLPADKQLMQHLVSELMSVPLHPYRPLWQFYLVQNYGEGSALICRMHHCIADGIALMGVLLSMTDRDGSQADDQDIRVQNTHSAGNGKQFGSQAIEIGQQLLNDPGKAVGTLLQGADAMASMSRFLLRRPDPKTTLKGKLGGHKKAVWGGPISLVEVKRIGREFGGTVNDVLVAMLAGALRTYLLSKGEKISKENLHSFIPVNLRSPNAKEKLGNQFGVVYLTLPVGIDDPLERLDRVHTHMSELKSSNEAIATSSLFHLFGALPGFQGVLLSVIDSKGTAVTTNVPGPQVQLYLAGSPIQTVMAWVPKSGHVGVGLSILSYNGGVWLGVASDQDLMDDPEKLLEYFCEEYQQFIDLADQLQQRRSARMKPMLELLDGAIKTVDQLLIESNGDSNQTENLEIARCQGVTKTGKRCKNPALHGDKFCRVHQVEPELS